MVLKPLPEGGVIYLAPGGGIFQNLEFSGGGAVATLRDGGSHPPSQESLEIID